MMENLEVFAPEIGLDCLVGILGQLFLVATFSWSLQEFGFRNKDKYDGIFSTLRLATGIEGSVNSFTKVDIGVASLQVLRGGSKISGQEVQLTAATMDTVATYA